MNTQAATRCQRPTRTVPVNRRCTPQRSARTRRKWEAGSPAAEGCHPALRATPRHCLQPVSRWMEGVAYSACTWSIEPWAWPPRHQPCPLLRRPRLADVMRCPSGRYRRLHRRPRHHCHHRRHARSQGLKNTRLHRRCRWSHRWQAGLWRYRRALQVAQFGSRRRGIPRWMDLGVLQKPSSGA